MFNNEYAEDEEGMIKEFNLNIRMIDMAINNISPSNGSNTQYKDFSNIGSVLDNF